MDCGLRQIVLAQLTNNTAFPSWVPGSQGPESQLQATNIKHTPQTTLFDVHILTVAVHLLMFCNASRMYGLHKAYTYMNEDGVMVAESKCNRT